MLTTIDSKLAEHEQRRYLIGHYSRLKFGILKTLNFFRHNQPVFPITDTDQTARHNDRRIDESTRVSSLAASLRTGHKSDTIPFWDAL